MLISVAAKKYTDYMKNTDKNKKVILTEMIIRKMNLQVLCDGKGHVSLFSALSNQLQHNVWCRKVL